MGTAFQQAGKDGQVVVFAQVLLEIFGRAAIAFEDARPEVVKQSEMVAQVFHSFAELMEIFREADRRRLSQRLYGRV